MINILIILLPLMLFGCAVTPVGMGSEKVWLTGFAAEQTPEVDREVRGRNADQYFWDVYNGVTKKKEGFRGAGGVVVISVRNGKTGKVYTSGTCELDRYGQCNISTRLSNIHQDSLLCMETPWPIAHQRVRPGFATEEHIMCARGIYDYFVVQSRGRTLQDSYAVIAIREAH